MSGLYIPNLSIPTPAKIGVSKRLKGHGVPDNSLGYDGDVYVNEDGSGFYSKANGAWVSTSASTPAPVATAASGMTQTALTAHWNAVTGATKYHFDLSTSNTFASFVTGCNNLDVGTALLKSVTGLSPGVTYYYRVRADGANGTSANSNTISQVTVPNAPALTLQSNSESEIVIQWTAVPGATSYEVEIADDDQFLDTEFNGDVGNVLTYTYGSSSNTGYFFRVRAVNSAGISPNSNAPIFWTICVAPNAAYDGADTVSCNLADSQQSDGATFNLYHETESGDVLEQSSDPGQTAWNFDVSGIPANDNVHVTAVNAGGESQAGGSQSIYNP